jgi:hypothetical protein
MHLKSPARCLAAPKEPGLSRKQGVCVIPRISKGWSSRARGDHQNRLFLNSNEPSVTVDPIELQKLKETSDVVCFDQTSGVFRQIVHLNNRAISDAAFANHNPSRSPCDLSIRLNPT